MSTNAGETNGVGWVVRKLRLTCIRLLRLDFRHWVGSDISKIRYISSNRGAKKNSGLGKEEVNERLEEPKEKKEKNGRMAGEGKVRKIS